jgi:hypothetical protein
LFEEAQVFYSLRMKSRGRSATSHLALLTGPRHRAALAMFLVIVLGHWAEHVVQAIQIYAFGWRIPDARGIFGMPFPWLVTSEVMHYAYALVMLIGLVALRNGFVGRSRLWWNVSLGIQAWHHVEHLLLLTQAMTGQYLLGRTVPTSIIQLFVPRVELHLFYNGMVFVPMVVAMYLHWRPTRQERSLMLCTCAGSG